MKEEKSDEKYVVKFVAYFRHHLTGKIVRAKNGKAIPIRIKVP